jgi:2-dehydropantoate 2-reductase
VRYLVYGTGAVGALLGARLSLAGYPVTFLARPKITESLRQDGIRLTGDGPAGWLQKPHVITALSEAFENQSPDLILLTVKAYDCQAAGEAIRAQASPPPPVVCLQNGIGNEETLAELLGQENVISATLTTAVQVVDRNTLRIERERGLGLAIGHSLIPKLFEELSASGFLVRQYPNRQSMKWSKVLTNIVSNASSAIVGWPPGQVFADAGIYRLEIEALRETVRVMRRLGLRPVNLPKVPVGLLGLALFLPAAIIHPILQRIVTGGRGQKMPSFHYDIGRGRSEVTWLNGAVVQEGIKLGVPTPANQVLLDTLQSLVAGDIDPSQFRDKPNKLIKLARQYGVPGL